MAVPEEAMGETVIVALGIAVGVAVGITVGVAVGATVGVAVDNAGGACVAGNVLPGVSKAIVGGRAAVVLA
jgi:hypothetical protein